MIGNAGLVTGLQYEQVAKLFAQYGQVENIVMLPKKSYCFVVYTTVESAVKAYQFVNAQTKLQNMDGPIYLLYTKSGNTLIFKLYIDLSIRVYYMFQI